MTQVIKRVSFVVLVCLSHYSYTQDWTTIDNGDLHLNSLFNFSILEGRLTFQGSITYADTNYAEFYYENSSIGINYPDTSTDYSHGFLHDCYYNGSRYVGGNFENFAGIEDADKILGLVDEQFITLGNGMCEATNSAGPLIEYDNKLIVAGRGDFDCNEDIFWAHLGAWDGEEWSPMGGIWGNLEKVFDMAVFQDKLYLVGGFDFILPTNSLDDFIISRNIACYSAETGWEAPGGGEGANGYIRDIHVDEEAGIMYLAGDMTDINGVQVSRVASWDGENFAAVGDNLEGSASDIDMYRGQLYVSGAYLFGWNEQMAYYNGVEWQMVPGTYQNINTYYDIADIEVFQEELWVCGHNLDYIGGMNVNGVAKYYLHPDSVQWGVPDGLQDLNQLEVQVFPNPNDGLLRLRLDRILPNASLEIVGTQGNMVLQQNLQGTLEEEIDLRHLAKGAYLLRLRGTKGQVLITEKIVLE